MGFLSRHGSAWILVGAMAWLSALGPNRADLSLAFFPWSIAFGAMLLAARSHRDLSLRTVVMVAVGVRLFFLLTQNDLSDDVFRYVWDGWIGVAGGISPYRYAPSDPALLRFQQDGIFPLLNSPNFVSVYPPLSQAVFWLGGWVHEGTGWPASGWVIRGAFTALECAGWALLARTGVAPRHLVLYAWNPLVVVAVAGSGHTEGGLVLGLGLLLFAVARRAPTLGWLGLSLAVLSKGIPLLAAPLVWRAFHRGAGTPFTPGGSFSDPSPQSTFAQPWTTARAARAALPAGVFGLLLAAVFLSPADLTGIRASTDLYVRYFEFNAGLYAVLKGAGWALFGDATDLVLGPLLRWSAVLAALWIGFRHSVRTLPDVARGLLWIFSSYLVFATTVHPWYLLWVLPFAPFVSSLRGSWLWASWASLATYFFYTGTPMWALSMLFWGGWLAWFAHDAREHAFRPLRRIAANRKARWMAPAIRGGKILDLGGGEGWVGDALAKGAYGLGDALGAAAKITLLDPSATRPGSVRADGEALPFASKSFDTVLLSFVLHHSSDAERVLAEALRVSRERVVLLESVFEGPLEHRLLRAADQWVNEKREGGAMGEPDAPLCFRTEAAWVQLATSLGARVVHVERPRGTVHRVSCIVLEPAGRDRS